MINRSLISQILSENDHIQQMAATQGPASLLNRYKQLSKLAKQLKRMSPDKPSVCLAYTILLVSADMGVEQLEGSFTRAKRDQQASTSYILEFERLQYQINLAVSMLT
ncbi:hypothetical protein [Spirosoma sp. KNUC1025]|uniref:hypothetical protein n=1 Tax=Spirosoma sp. KNUC1025 TaxID=2894082 RepID=UPI0038665E61|nr:hypothetical protein LN737_16130 [Spirosoma sp. KNUC1025]